MKGSLVRRSGRGEASVWTLRCDFPRTKKDPRKQKAMTFTGDRASAEEALYRFVQRMKKSTEEKDVTKDLKLYELYALWREDDSSRQKPRALSTKYHDDRRWANWLEPHFGNHVASEISEIEIEDFYRDIRRDRVQVSKKPEVGSFHEEINRISSKQKKQRTKIKGLSPNSVVRVHSLLAAILNWGYRRRLIPTNPMEHVTKPRGESLPPRAPSFEEVQALLDYLIGTDPLMWLAVRLTCTLGIRRSELLALKFGSLVLDRSAGALRGTVRIEKGVVRVPGDNGLFIETTTKSGAPSHRTLGLDEELCDVFSELVETRKELVRTEGIDEQMFFWDGYIFTDDLTALEPWYPDTLSHMLAVARETSGVTGGPRSQSRVPITFRSLRIYCASQVYSSEMDVRTAKAVLGHASLATTDRWYLAFEDEKRRDATVTIGERHRRSLLVENSE